MRADDRRPDAPLHALDSPSNHDIYRSASSTSTAVQDHGAHDRTLADTEKDGANDASAKATAPPPTSDNTEAPGEAVSPVENEKQKEKIDPRTRLKNALARFMLHIKETLLSSWLNVLLVFVPVGIAVKVAGAKPEIVFSMNAVAIVPLAGLLAYATECVALKLGDVVGALLNISFGNAVELIIL